MKLFCILLFAATLLPRPIPALEDIWKDFDSEAVSDYGFIAQNHESHWYVRVWANQALKDDCLGKIHRDAKAPCSYLLLLSVRDSRKAATKDGDKWMDEAKKKIEKLKK